MTTHCRNMIISANLALLLVFFAWQTAQKERTLSNGRLILLQLAPVDPRSLMQGDYMSLNYAIARWRMDSIPEKGFLVLQLDEHNVGILQRLQPNEQPLYDGETLLKYSTWGSRIGAEAYFFEEGQSEKYENARYGGLRVDQHGNSILVGLYGEDLKLIE